MNFYLILRHGHYFLIICPYELLKSYWNASQCGATDYITDSSVFSNSHRVFNCSPLFQLIYYLFFNILYSFLHFWILFCKIVLLNRPGLLGPNLNNLIFKFCWHSEFFFCVNFAVGIFAWKAKFNMTSYS